MPLKHNKKRNVGLVYEFLARYIGQAIIEGQDDKITKAKTIIQKHFNKKTDLHEELKLFRSLHSTKTPTRDRAIHLLNRVREGLRTQSQTRLDLEKTSLIHEINITLGDDQFFNRSIEDYKSYATIQVLLNEWRSKNLVESITEIVELEEKLIEHLCSGESPMKLNDVLEMKVDDVDKMTVSIMTEKVNKKFSDLSDEQRHIVQNYVFIEDNQDARKTLVESLKKLGSRIAYKVDLGLKEFQMDKVLSEKLESVKSILNEYKFCVDLNDEVIAFYLSLPNLETELDSK